MDVQSMISNTNEWLTQHTSLLCQEAKSSPLLRIIGFVFGTLFLGTWNLPVEKSFIVMISTDT